MPRISPTAEGFRATWRRPSLTFAEITWRWVIGATTSALLLYGFIEYLRTLPVSNTELLFLKTRQPVLVGQAIDHIVRGSLDRVVLSAVLAAIALACLWILTASLGRLATVRALLEYFAIHRDAVVSAGAAGIPNDGQRDVASNVSTESSEQGEGQSGRQPLPMRALIHLNFLRLAVFLAAACGFVGASIIAGFASPNADPQPGLAFLLFLALAALICLIWSVLNWFLSLATVFAVRDGEDAMGALSAAAGFIRDRARPVTAVSAWNSLAHIVAFIAFSSVGAFPLGLMPILPGRLVLAGLILVSLAYFAVVDWLYTARLAGYVCILEMPQALLAPVLPPLATPPPGGPQPSQGILVHAAIDRDEPILSDVPNLALET